VLRRLPRVWAKWCRSTAAVPKPARRATSSTGLSPDSSSHYDDPGLPRSLTSEEEPMATVLLVLAPIAYLPRSVGWPSHATTG